MSVKKVKRVYQLRRDKKDKRDYKFQAQISKLPTKVDLRHKCSPIENQGELGSCTGHAIVSGVEMLLHPSRANYSRLFVYYNGRVIEGTTEIDNGAELRSVVRALAKHGVCRERYWPYDVERFDDKPSKGAYRNAGKLKVMRYERINSLRALKAALAQELPVVFGYTVFKSFESAKLARTGIMPMPKPGEKDLGGHAVVAVGYDDEQQIVIVRNSWGEEWGDKGYFYMPYEFISNKEWASDFWTFQL